MKYEHLLTTFEKCPYFIGELELHGKGVLKVYDKG